MFVPTPSADLKEFRPFCVVLSFHLGLCNRICLVVFKKRRESGTLKTELLPQASPRSPPPPAPVPSRNLLPTGTGSGTGTGTAVPTPGQAGPAPQHLLGPSPQRCSRAKGGPRKRCRAGPGRGSPRGPLGPPKPSTRPCRTH